jgi:hypothetical protein
MYLVYRFRRSVLSLLQFHLAIMFLTTICEIAILSNVYFQFWMPRMIGTLIH